MRVFDKSKIGLWLGLFLLLCAVAVVWILDNEGHKVKRAELRYNSESLSKSITLRLKGNEDYLLMLAKDRAAGSLGPGIFQERASTYVREHPEIINITWVDSDFYIRDVAPRAANRNILGLHLDLAEPKRASNLARETGRPVYTRPFEAIQGRSSFEVWVPVYDGSRFIGLLGGIYSCQRLLEVLVPPNLRQAEHAALLDASGVIVAELTKTGIVDQKMTCRLALAIRESGLVVQLGSYSSGVNWLVVALEMLCLSLLLGMTYAIWNLREEISMRKRLEDELRVQTVQLQDELAERQATQETLQEQAVVLEEEIEERRLAEEALIQSEATVRNKLKAIVEPDGDISTLELSDIVDSQMLQSMLEDFYNLTGLLGAVLDLSGKVLVAVGWQDICTKFHRCHPDTLKNCIESDIELTNSVPAGTFRQYRCKNGMWDMVTPLVVGGKHVGNIFIGQFFYEDEVIDLEFFRQQARRHGFDEAQYLSALERTPRFSREKANAGIQFYAKLTEMISSLSFTSIKLSRMLNEQIQLEHQLLQSQKMEALGQLAGGVAHDFNNVLQVICGYGELLKLDDKLNGQQIKSIDRILNAAEKAAQLTKGLLSFSRKQAFEPKMVDLHDVVENVNKFLIRVIGEDIQFKTISRRSALRVNADVGQLEQVLVNLATNARDAMQKGGVLTIETGLEAVEAPVDHENGHAKPGRYALITVSDTGSGMDEETRKRIFEPFYTTKEVGKGTGLGLSIVYGIIKQHDGIINVYSEPGHGTTFRIYLPIYQAAQSEEEMAAEVPLPVGGKETIMVVEDDAGVRDLVVSVLARVGYTVIQAVDGQDAVDKFAAHQEAVDMIIMDMIMPKKNGMAAYEEISRMKPHVKVLYSSGYTADFMEKRGLLESEVELIMKPVHPMELLQRIRKFLDA